MQVFDASSAIYAWDNYPIHKFSKLWDWLSSQINLKALSISSIAMSEVEINSPDCWEWFRSENIQTHAITNAMLQESLRIKSLLGIVGDKYGKGVDENDILIVSNALVLRKELITNEGRQNSLPADPLKYKIPAVCSIQSVAVRSYDFLEYINRTDAVF